MKRHQNTLYVTTQGAYLAKDGEAVAVRIEKEVKLRVPIHMLVLVAYQKRKAEEIVHPFLEEKTTVGLLPYLQAALLARHLRGDLDAYPPFLWR
jgi:CRISPR-associated protein Cas1